MRFFQIAFRQFQADVRLDIADGQRAAIGLKQTIALHRVRLDESDHAGDDLGGERAGPAHGGQFGIVLGLARHAEQVGLGLAYDFDVRVGFGQGL